MNILKIGPPFTASITFLQHENEHDGFFCLFVFSGLAIRNGLVFLQRLQNFLRVLRVLVDALEADGYNFTISFKDFRA